MEKLNNIPISGKWSDVASRLNNNLLKIEQELDSLGSAAYKSKGYFDSEEALKAAYPTPSSGDWAVVGVVDDNGVVGVFYYLTGINTDGSLSWVKTKIPFSADIELAEYLKTNGEADDLTVDGLNIKDAFDSKLDVSGNADNLNLGNKNIISFIKENAVGGMSSMLSFNGIVDDAEVSNDKTSSEKFEIYYVRSLDIFAAKVGSVYYPRWGNIGDAKYYQRYREGGSTLANKNSIYVTPSMELWSFHDGVFQNTEKPTGILELIATKQDVLKSGKNIKTINGMDVLGSGNLEVKGGGGGGSETGVYIHTVIDLD